MRVARSSSQEAVVTVERAALVIDSISPDDLPRVVNAGGAGHVDLGEGVSGPRWPKRSLRTGQHLLRLLGGSFAWIVPEFRNGPQIHPKLAPDQLRRWP